RGSQGGCPPVRVPRPPGPAEVPSVHDDVARPDIPLADPVADGAGAWPHLSPDAGVSSVDQVADTSDGVAPAPRNGDRFHPSEALGRRPERAGRSPEPPIPGG